IARGTKRMTKARIANLLGIHSVVLRSFPWRLALDCRVISDVIVSATTPGVTERGAGFIPVVMDPMTKPGRAVINPRFLLPSKVSLSARPWQNASNPALVEP